MEPSSSGIGNKKLKSPGLDIANMRNAITCSNMPEGLFDVAAAKKHFTKFGKVLRIRLLPKRQMCVIEYDSPVSAEKAVLNAGAYDGFMFEVSRNKPKVRKKSKKEDDPDWVPDSDVEEELNAMGSTPIYRPTRQKAMELDSPNPSVPVVKVRGPPIRSSTFKKPDINQNDRNFVSSQKISGTSSPVAITGSQTSLSSTDAVVELLQLRTRLSGTADEQWRTLDARDRILRNWGGTGSRVKIGGATIGTCQDMCPEKERLHRQAEHQVMTLETVVGSDGELEPWRAVKQYSRSSADQEMPMCYELRPAHVLMRTCSYLLHEIADTDRQVSLSDWFHFMWDRFRGIRKDITQQALCCAESISLVEMCARFHAHCAARLADLEHTQFDQKLNTDNLTKCLQTLKHMYTDAKPEQKPREAEFRGYIALLNLGDSNFWWEVKQLSQEIQKSRDISFAIKVFNALDNNNYVRFFRLVREEATYLQACILLRYFNDVRARALARIVKAFAPRGGSRYPAFEVMDILAFENIDNMISFINHYGLRIGRAAEEELSIILDRNQFIEDSDPYPIARSIQLIESKRHHTIGQVIAGGSLPDSDFRSYTLYSSFTKDGHLKDEALIAEGQQYNTLNDSNKDIRTLKADIMKQIQGSKKLGTIKPAPSKGSFLRPQTIQVAPKSPPKVRVNDRNENYLNNFSFKPAIPLFPNKPIKTIPENVIQVDSNTTFSFAKPQEYHSSLFSTPSKYTFNTFEHLEANEPTSANKESVFKNPQSFFKKTTWPSKGEASKSLFSQNNLDKENRSAFSGRSDTLFNSKNLFTQKDTSGSSTNIFGKKASEGMFKQQSQSFGSNSYTDPKSIFGSVSSLPNGEAQPTAVSPSSLFKSVNQSLDTKSDTSTHLQSKNKPFGSVATQIFESASNVQYKDCTDNQTVLEKQKVEQLKIEIQRQKEQMEREELRHQHEEARRIQEEMRIKEAKKIQEQLKRNEEAKRQAERQAEEARMFKEKVEIESSELMEELLNELNKEIVYQQLKEETKLYIELMDHANTASNEIMSEICSEICMAEITAVKYRISKLMRKWYNVWRQNYVRNIKRRDLLDDTPVWLSDLSPDCKGKQLRKSDESSVLSHMNKIHRGYSFSGEPKLKIVPEPIKIVDTIRSPLLKRMKQIRYPYDKCFFWKITLLSPGAMKWMYKRLEVENWLLKAFEDNKKHTESDTLIQVGRESWNKLMNFAISVSLVNNNKRHQINEAIAGTNGVLIYASENDADCVIDMLSEIVAQKYKYQKLPVAVIIPRIASLENKLEPFLEKFASDGEISCYKFITVELDSLGESMNIATKAALRWLAKKFPPPPNLEIDNLKSFCQRYLGSELWYKLKVENSTRLRGLFKNIYKLVQFYNTAVDKLTEIICDEDLCNHPSFPLEFQKYLSEGSPYPKPYEFITSSVKSMDNLEMIKTMIQSLKLSVPQSGDSNRLNSVEEHIREYCNQIGWFSNTDNIVCKVLSLLPDDLRAQTITYDKFAKDFEKYDIGLFLNVIVYEKINSLNKLVNYFLMYDKLKLKEYCNYLWWYDIDIVNNLKHKVSDSCETDDDIQYYIESKRIKIALQNEGCIIKERDQTMVEESILEKEKELSQYIECERTVKYLEEKLESEREKSFALEKLLQNALNEN